MYIDTVSTSEAFWTDVESDQSANACLSSASHVEQPLLRFCSNRSVSTEVRHERQAAKSTSVNNTKREESADKYDDVDIVVDADGKQVLVFADGIRIPRK